MSELPPVRKFAVAGVVVWAEIRRDEAGAPRAAVVVRRGDVEFELQVVEAGDLIQALQFNAIQATALVHLLGEDDLALRPHEGRA